MLLLHWAVVDLSVLHGPLSESESDFSWDLVLVGVVVHSSVSADCQGDGGCGNDGNYPEV